MAKVEKAEKAVDAAPATVDDDPTDGNGTGVYVTTNGDTVTLQASPNARAGYEAKGYRFIGYTPA